MTRAGEREVPPLRGAPPAPEAAPPCEVLGIHHVAFAHRDAAVEEGLRRVFGLTCLAEEEGEGFTERSYAVGDGCLQTLEASGPGTVGRFVERRGGALHHVAFEVADLDGSLRRLREHGVRLVDESARPGGSGTRVAFLHPSAMGGLLVELVETEMEQR